ERGHTQADLAPLDVFNSSLAEGVSADVFVVIGMADLSSLPFFFVLPVDSPARALAGEIRRALADTQKIEVAAEQIGNAVIAGSRQTLERLKKAQPTNRPEIAAGFQATADHAAQVLFIPSPDMRRLIGVLMPTLPAIVGGGPTKSFTQSIVWAAVGLDLPPRAAAMHVVVQSTSPEAARLLDSEVAAMSTTIGQRAEVREQIPNFAELMARLAPQVSGDQLIIEISEDDGDMAEWSAILVPLLKAARSATPGTAPAIQSPAE
ncbi:MAG TPA: hypothetical protein VHV08_04490, partial [Pirellulales bacterium]|nr:hypothetical protein [Pirellulales bacterium]